MVKKRYYTYTLKLRVKCKLYTNNFINDLQTHLQHFNCLCMLLRLHFVTKRSIADNITF